MQGEINVTQIMINGTLIEINKVKCKVVKDLTIHNTGLLLLLLLLCVLQVMTKAEYLTRKTIDIGFKTNYEFKQ